MDISAGDNGFYVDCELQFKEPHLERKKKKKKRSSL